MSLQVKRFFGILVFFLMLTHAPSSAQSFTIGLNAGFPSLIEARVGYETPGFGVRVGGSFLIIPSLSLEGYANFAQPWGRLRAGGSLSLLYSAFTADTFLAPCALVGAVFDFSPNVSLAVEWRPGYPFLVSSQRASSTASQNDTLQYLLLSFGLALEFRF